MKKIIQLSYQITPLCHLLSSVSILCWCLYLFQAFEKEILADEKGEVGYAKVLQTLEAASGAAYGTGK